MKKLTKKEIEVLIILRNYPDSIIMDDGYITGGHGRVNARSVKGLKAKGYIETWGDRRDRLSEIGLNALLENNDKGKTLRLPLKREWFEMTKLGIKKEDYREINEYWCKRFCHTIEWRMESYIQPDVSDENGVGYQFSPLKYEVNIMTLGHPKSTDKERILKLEHKEIEIRTGNPEWGAEPGKLYFVIKHGKIIKD